MRAVAAFDTNVLFSAVAWKGKPYQCLELARAGTIDAVTCPELLDELAVKLPSKLSLSAEQIVEILADLLPFVHVVRIVFRLLLS